MVTCVISTKQDGILKDKLIIPDSKVLYCPMQDKHEAHYICSILNSKPVTEIIEGYTIELQRGIDIVDNIKIPKYDPKIKLHQKLSELSQKAHNTYLRNEDISPIQEEIDDKVLKLF